MQRIHALAAFSLAALAIIPAMAQTPPAASGLVTERNISMNTALELASASLERCRADGFKVTVTVINRHTRASVVLSDDGVNPHTVENSMRKAYTAFTTRSSTADMAKRAQPGLSGFMLLDRISPLEGGLPIFAANKELVGAIGISGAPGGDKDAACAQVGLDKIAGKL
ncbi:MAG: heme-binding protein [Burkholderiaceae bacterium]